MMLADGDREKLLTYPCPFEYKAFGPGDDAGFPDRVQAAVASVVPVARQAMRMRPSSGGRYQCVSVLVTLQNRTQLEAVYSALRKIDGLKYLL